MIRIESLRKEYANRCVLDIPSASFASGIRYAIMGANGSGKSTLLRILAGIVKPDTGTVQTDVSDIGYLPQHPYAFGFSVKKNIQITLPDQEGSEAVAMQALRSVGIQARAEQSGSKLSGGEAQRLAIARVLAVKRDVLLLDEPTAAADVNGTDMIEKAVADYHAQSGCTLILSTHFPAQALRMADIVVFMEDGRIVEQGEPQQILYSPQTPEVNAFLKHWRI